MKNKTITEMTKILCMSEESAIDFLERVAEAKDKINELTGIAQTDETYKILSMCYSELENLLSPICSNCQVRAEKFITSPARLYDLAMAELPGGTRMSWTGEWFCPKCRHPVAYGNRWWNDQRLR